MWRCSFTIRTAPSEARISRCRRRTESCGRWKRWQWPRAIIPSRTSSTAIWWRTPTGRCCDRSGIWCLASTTSTPRRTTSSQTSGATVRCLVTSIATLISPRRTDIVANRWRSPDCRCSARRSSSAFLLRSSSPVRPLPSVAAIRPLARGTVAATSRCNMWDSTNGCSP